MVVCMYNLSGGLDGKNAEIDRGLICWFVVDDDDDDDESFK